MRLVQRSSLFALLALFAAPAPALACNPIEFLFGGCRASAPPPNPGPQAHRAAVRAVTIHARKKSDAAMPRQAVLAPPPGAGFASLEHFAADPTLRGGDIIVTPRGFMVYRANSDAFSPLDGRNKDLLALEQASLRPRSGWQAPVAALRPGLAKDATPKGGLRTISFNAAAR